MKGLMLAWALLHGRPKSSPFLRPENKFDRVHTRARDLGLLEKTDEGCRRLGQCDERRANKLSPASGWREWMRKEVQGPIFERSSGGRGGMGLRNRLQIRWDLFLFPLLASVSFAFLLIILAGQVNPVRVSTGD